LKGPIFFLEDKTLKVYNLKEAPCFTSAAGAFNDRFVLYFISKTLGTNDFFTN
jgi:hypothetical protein